MNNSPFMSVGVAIMMLLLVVLPGIVFRACDSDENTDQKKQKPSCPCEVYSGSLQKSNDSVFNIFRPGQKIRLVLHGTGETGHIYLTRFFERESCIGTVTVKIETY